MGSPLRFWFIKEYDKPFENCLDIIRESLNDAGSREFALKALEVTCEAGHNDIYRDLTSGTAGKLRGINLGLNYQTLAPPAAPRPELGQLIQFRDFINPAKPLEGVLPPESLMEFTAQLSHKVGEILLLNADDDLADGYIAFKDGLITAYGFKFVNDFVIRFHRGEFAVDIFKVGMESDAQTEVSEERIREAIEKTGMSPCTVNTHEGEMTYPFWTISKEGFNAFYGTKLGSLGTWETNLATLHQVSDPGLGHYDIYPDGVSYAYPAGAEAPEKKKPWWKVW